MSKPTDAADTDAITRTTCPYCGVGCGIQVSTASTGQISITGDPRHPANQGQLCSKGYALAETLDHEGRLLQPVIDGRTAGWEQALEEVASRFRQVIDEFGPQAVAFYVSGQLLTEDYYVANKLMKGFIGSANIDTNSRLCMASAVAGYKRALGTDTVPCDYTDLDQARLFILAGTNTAWCHPVLYQRIERTRQRHPEARIVVIDPRRTATCGTADLHLQLKPGTDTWLFNGLLHHLAEAAALDWGFIEQQTTGLLSALTMARETAPSIASVSGVCEIPESDIARFYEMFARTDRTITLFSQGINQSSSGTDKVNSIINCHLATGRIGKPGAGPFSLTGQPNAMGGREVGGLANQLAAHMDIGNAEHRSIVQSFWQAPTLPETAGHMAVDMFSAIAEGGIKAIWIMATNPLVSLPDTNRIREALENCPLVVVSDCMRDTDTTAVADILLPAQTWAEKDGTVTNAERRISRQRSFLPAAGEARPDWWIISRVAQRMGFGDQFNYHSAAEIFREHAALSGSGNNGSRTFDISALSQISDQEYERLEPVQWPLGRDQTAIRPFADGKYYHADGKARLIPVNPRLPRHQTSPEYPLALNTGRVRDHWHTLTRTGKSPRLSQHRQAPYLELHPDDAYRFRLEDGVLTRVASQWGAMTVRSRVSGRQRRGEIYIPMHWNDQFASAGRTGALVNPVTDPVSGQPEFKHTPVCLQAIDPVWEGFLFTRRNIDLSKIEYWVKTRALGVWGYEMAGFSGTEDWSEWAQALFQSERQGAEWVEYIDHRTVRYRAACIKDGRLEACIFIAPGREQLPERSWLAQLFRNERLTGTERMSLLAGQPAENQPDRGPVICSCHDIGRNTILGEIYQQGLHSVESISKRLRAGSSCGTCLPELRELLHYAGQSGF